MTLIFTRIDPNWVTQTSDRAISVPGLPQPKILDKSSNKAIIFRASDALVTIGFTGLAVLDGLPTDQWIAEQLFGRPLDRAPVKGYPALSIEGWRPAPNHDVVRSFELAAELLAPAFQRVHEAHPKQQLTLTLVIAGWKWSRRHHPRPFFLSIHKEQNSSKFFIKHYRRYGSSSELNRKPIPILCAAPGCYLDKADLQNLAEQLDPAGWYEEFDILVDTYQRVAAVYPAVSANFMSVTIPPLHHKRVVVRYHTSDSTAVPCSTQGISSKQPVTYSPWLVGSRLMMAPAIVAGPLRMTMYLDDTEVFIVLPTNVPHSSSLFEGTGPIPIGSIRPMPRRSYR